MKKTKSKKAADYIELSKQFCKANKLVYAKIIAFAKPKNKNQEALNAAAILFEIIDRANKKDNKGSEWIPDWTNYNEYKYYPYFSTSGSGFAFTDTTYWRTGTSAGSRLCFLELDTAEKIAKKYLSIYEKFMMK